MFWMFSLIFRLYILQFRIHVSTAWRHNADIKNHSVEYYFKNFGQKFGQLLSWYDDFTVGC
jgi:hypothetical protein